MRVHLDRGDNSQAKMLMLSDVGDLFTLFSALLLTLQQHDGLLLIFHEVYAECEQRNTWTWLTKHT